MDALTEEYTRGTVQLRNDNAFSTVDDESTFRSHVRDRTQEHILNHCIKVFVIGVGTIKLQFGFQGNTIGQAALQTVVNRIVRLIDIVVKELEHEVVAGICNREILGKHLIQSVVLSFFGWGI